MTDPSTDLSADAMFDKALDIAEKHLKRAIEEGGVLGPYVAVAMIEAAVNSAVDETSHEDVGLHTVCAVMTPEFLAFSREAGNDLSTPVPEAQFPGLKPGDRWCLCAPRWKEALDAGAAPQVVLDATHEETLAIVPLGVLKDHAVEA